MTRKGIVEQGGGFLIDRQRAAGGRDPVDPGEDAIRVIAGVALLDAPHFLFGGQCRLELRRSEMERTLRPHRGEGKAGESGEGLQIRKVTLRAGPGEKTGVASKEMKFQVGTKGGIAG